MGLFNSSAHSNLQTIDQQSVIGRKFRVPMDMDRGLFYSRNSNGSSVMFTRPVARRILITVGDRLPIPGMFEVYWLLMGNKERVGFMFVSQFQTMNEGGYIVAYTQSGVGKATSVEVLLKTDELVIYNFANRGTMVVSPSISDEVDVIFSEQ